MCAAMCMEITSVNEAPCTPKYHAEDEPYVVLFFMYLFHINYTGIFQNQGQKEIHHKCMYRHKLLEVED